MYHGQCGKICSQRRGMMEATDNFFFDVKRARKSKVEVDNGIKSAFFWSKYIGAVCS